MLTMGGLGLGAFLRRRRRRPLEVLGPDPAGELRAKLAETKAVVEEEPAPAGPVEPSLDPESRRRSVHERAREAIDELG